MDKNDVCCDLGNLRTIIAKCRLKNFVSERETTEYTFILFDSQVTWLVYVDWHYMLLILSHKTACINFILGMCNINIRNQVYTVYKKNMVIIFIFRVFLLPVFISLNTL